MSVKSRMLWIAYNFLSLQGSLQFNCWSCRWTDKLWIAYNFLSLQGSLQCGMIISFSSNSCELLTIFYLYKVLCSVAGGFSNVLAGCELLTIFYLYKVLCSVTILYCIFCSVVNCLQFFIFTRFFAVCEFCSSRRDCCELLTIFYLYKVLCSYGASANWNLIVVNCLQFFIFTRFFAVNFVEQTFDV
mgnify:CR=1 FL=1